MKSEAKSWFSNCHIDNLLSNKYITSFMHFDNNSQFTVNVRITHIWKKDACVLWCTHIKTFVWHHGCLFCCFSVANGWRNRNRAEQRNRSWTKNAAQQMEKKKKKSKKHLSLQIFWSIARAVLFGYIMYCVRQSKEYVTRYLIVIWSHMKVYQKSWSHQKANTNCRAK